MTIGDGIAVAATRGAVVAALASPDVGGGGVLLVVFAVLIGTVCVIGLSSERRNR